LYATADLVATDFMYFFSEVIARCCVPLFFVISGYLFFHNVNTFAKRVYLRKLKSRAYSILLPYLIWNLIGFLFLWIKTQPCMHGFFPGVAGMHLDFMDFLSSFWSFKYSETGDSIMAEAFIPGYPIDYPLWFLRDLMVMIVLSPFIYLCVKYMRVVYVMGLGVLFMCGVSFGEFRLDGLFFFSSGAALAVWHCDNIVPVLKRAGCILPVYLLVAICDLLTRHLVWNHYVHALSILFGVVAFMYVAVKVASRSDGSSAFLISGAFFVYLSHTLISRILIKLIAAAINPVSSLSWIVCYLTVIVLLVVIPLVVYAVLSRYVPKIVGVLVGGR